MNVFDEAKARVPIRTAVSRYGYEPNRAGYICCPFHDEKTASLKIYDDSFYCYGCHVHGSVIDFVGKLFNLDPISTVRRLDQDFALILPLDRPPSTEEREAAKSRQIVTDAQRMFEEWRDQMLNALADALKVAYFADWDHLSDVEVMAIRWKEAFEAWFDILLAGTLNEKMDIFRDRKEIARRCATIINRMPTRSQIT